MINPLPDLETGLIRSSLSLKPVSLKFSSKFTPEKILKSRKATVPCPFNLKLDQKLRSRNKHLLMKTQNFSGSTKDPVICKSSSKKKHLYGSLSPNPSLYNKSLDNFYSKISRKFTLRDPLTPKLSLKYVDDCPEVVDSTIKQTFGKLKLSLKLSPRIVKEKESKWLPKLRVDDLIKII